MQTFTDSITLQPTVAEQRGTVLIPSKKLRSDFAALRACADVLESANESKGFRHATTV